MPRESKYKDEVIRLRKEGKTYKEIMESTGCAMSVISYYTSKAGRGSYLLRFKKNRESGETYKKAGEYRERNRQIISDYLNTHPCVDCGNSDRRVLEFDHVRGEKIGNVSSAINGTWKVEKLLAEIAKCEVRCCNCHRIVTRERNKY